MNLLSIREAAKELRLTERKLRKGIMDKKIPYVRLGPRVVFRREDLESLLNKNVVVEEAVDKTSP